MNFPRHAGVIAIAMAATLAATGAQAAPAKGVPALAAQHWDLVEWSGRPLPEGKKLRLDFDAKRGSFSSSTGCNRTGGAVKVKGSSIRFGDK